jgi:cadmium resistance protein CadD (predicted permease)
MMSWMVFWIDPSLVATQVSVSVTAMLTMIAYRFALSGLVPRLVFLTSLDFFVLVSTLTVFMSMLEVLYTAHLATHDKIEKARLVDRHARWVVPIIYVGLAADTLYFRVLF